MSARLRWRRRTSSPSPRPCGEETLSLFNIPHKKLSNRQQRVNPSPTAGQPPPHCSVRSVWHVQRASEPLGWHGGQTCLVAAAGCAACPSCGRTCAAPRRESSLPAPAEPGTKEKGAGVRAQILLPLPLPRCAAARLWMAAWPRLPRPWRCWSSPLSRWAERRELSSLSVGPAQGGLGGTSMPFRERGLAGPGRAGAGRGRKAWAGAGRGSLWFQGRAGPGRAASQQPGRPVEAAGLSAA